ncbi:hypothetical protein AK812_SmicGene27151 [Symbiodinium microadriaticum]|uniref:Uncharacterized protein n=1 Tax=Symbiodinium microadriaticum TaxID=2951 RepID=A0A1Q9D7V9_SYMMI|nr:hypothetical protein AK812_SmicGene27151 [Symbiodinium microadriaticum]
MVARSITRSPVALLFRLYTMYQPGGESEKAYILQYLVTPPKAQTAVQMVATLRQWERMLLRADNLSIAKPDPSLLVRGLNALVGDVWAKDRDVTFRTQLVKSRLGVDVSPTWVYDDGTRATANATNFTHDYGCLEIPYEFGFFGNFCLFGLQRQLDELKLKVQLIFYDNLVTVRRWHLRPECCEISWKKGNFKVVHPVWRELRTTIRGGCPELAQEQAARLVNEIEDKKLKELKDGVSLLKAKLEHLVHEEKLPWTTYVERYLEGGLAKDLWKALQGSFMKFLYEHMLYPLCKGTRRRMNHLKDLPFPRRLRKRMLDSTRWVVHLPVHRDEEQPKAEEYGPDAVVVNVPGDLLTKAYVPLLWGAATDNANGKGISLVCGWKISETYDKNGVTGMRESELNLGKFGEGTKDQSLLGWPTALKLKLAKAVRESSFEAAKMKYLLVAKFTIPESYVTGEFEPTGSDPLDEEVGSKDLFDEEDKVSGGDDGHTDGSGGDDRDPGEAIVEGEPVDAEEDSEEADTGAGVGPIPLDIQAPKATYLLFAEPLLNDKGPTIASAIQSIVLYLQKRRCRIGGEGAQATDEKDFVDVWIGETLLACGCQGSGVDAEGKGAETGSQDDCLVKKRRYAASGALIRLEFEERWSEGLYLGLSDEVADGHLVYVDGTFTHTRSVRDKAKLVDAKEHQPDEDQEMPVLEVIVEIGVLVWQSLSTIQIMNLTKIIHVVTRRGSPEKPMIVHMQGQGRSPPKAWASGVYRHGGVLGVRNSTKDYPLATKVVNWFIQEKLGEHACWSTFSMHRNLNVKKHRDSHNARDKASYLIPISDFKDGGLWVQLKTGEEVKEEDVVILDGDRGNEGGEVQEPQQVEVELEPREAVLHIRMTVQEWNVTSARHGPDHFIEGMVERWKQINLEVDDLNSVIPAVIMKDIERDWAQEPRLILVDDQGEELHLGRMLGMSTIRVPNFEPGGMSSDWLKVCKVHNAVMNVEEVIVLWIHRRIALHPVESDEPRADGGDPPVPEMDFRGGIPRLAMMCARDVNDLMKFVEVAEGETSEEDDVRMMKATPENIYTPNIEDIVSKVSPESPLKVTHTVDPREVLPVVDVWVPAMEAELAALDKMAAIKGARVQKHIA